MPNCKFCLRTDFGTDDAVSRHQKLADSCRKKKEAADLAALAQIVPHLDSESDSDPELDEDDGYGRIYGSDGVDEAYYDVYMPSPSVSPPPQPPSNAATASTNEESSDSALPDEPDDEDGFIQEYPGAAKVYNTAPPPLPQLYEVLKDANNLHAPFNSEVDWKLALWAHLYHVSDAAFTNLLQLDKKEIDIGGTVIPVILSTDKTQLTSFSGEHSAYPVYLSIGNIAKHVRRMPSRRAFRLIGYLPTLKPDETTMSDALARTIRHRLFHKSMEIICEPLFEPAKDGVMLPDSKGDVRKCFPILASYVADYPEQCLVTCIRYGQTCPKCTIHVDDFGQHAVGDPRRQADTLASIHRAREGTAAERDKILKDAGLNNIMPFWARWEHVDIHDSITSDNLHQNIQGVGAVLIEWLADIVGEKELDARIARLPLAHGLRNFSHGISCLSRVSGAERKAIYSQLLGGVVGRVAPEAVQAARALLDFIIIAQFECHSDATLAQLKTSLDDFHKHKAVFVRANPNINFAFPKMHMLEHYEPCIRLLATTDNYNTEATERLHIELAKDAFKATNRREYLVQMCRWLQRRQAVHQFAVWLAYQQGTTYDARKKRPRKHHISPIVLAKQAPAHKTVAELVREHGLTNFDDALRRFLQKWHRVDVARYDMPLPDDANRALQTLHSQKLDVWYQAKFLTPDLQTYHAPDVLDIAHATGERVTRLRRTVKPRYDTVLVETKGNGVAGIGGLKDIRIARLRAIFNVPRGLRQDLFGDKPPQHLAFVEWFSRPTRRDPTTKMYRISRSFKPGQTSQKEVAVVEVMDLRRSCHLLPEFGASDVDRALTPYTVLDAFDHFYLNDFVDKHAYQTM
ncbi:hypothetical protein EXIGLDRAFT_810315 [Exidia glandulosa HHB12029]|uniref:Uncharacterized protein n=1 Tax=Exidia glandulosa HHB12029 TaxID=1314781 RepID=A0A165CLP0_EXIGL|nr:hypothetical protein EXIGLDRAFT_810315 [Exidia glandulosa HHB12029]